MWGKVLLTALIGSSLVPIASPRPAAAFCNDPGPSGEDPDRDTEELCHQQMVRAGLPFLRDTVLTGLAEWVDDPDDDGLLGGPLATSDNHFDSCNFDGATERLNGRYLVPGLDASWGAVPRMTGRRRVRRDRVVRLDPACGRGLLLALELGRDRGQ